MTLALRIALVAVVSACLWVYYEPFGEALDVSKVHDSALPVTSEQVHAYTQQAKDNATKAIDAILAISPEQQTFDNTLGAWNRFGYSLIEPMGILNYVKESGLPDGISATLAQHELLSFLEEAITNNPKVFSCLIGYCKKALTSRLPPTPFERYQIQAVLDSVDLEDETLGDADRKLVLALKGLSAEHDKQPYDFWKGQGKPKGSQPLTVMTLNICGVPGTLTLPNGGMVPWPKRLAPLAQKVLQADPDIICLNEVYGYDAPKDFYNNFKERYGYFYSSIAPRTFGLSLSTLGLSSGLFVASKYPLASPHFMEYSKRGYPTNDGLFDFIVMKDDKPLAHVYTTHLQPDHTEEFAHIRSLQLQEVVKKIGTDFTAVPHLNIPYFFGGDLNIPWGSGEPGLAIMREHFYDAYNHDRTNAEQGATWTDFFTQLYYDEHGIPLHIDTKPAIIDYALLAKHPHYDEHDIHTVLVPIFSLQNPEISLSDHNGLLTTIMQNRRAERSSALQGASRKELTY